MDRRRFFSSLLGGAIAAHELDIDKLLWVPGKKTIFIPPPGTYDDIVELMIQAIERFPNLSSRPAFYPTVYWRDLYREQEITTLKPTDSAGA